MKPTIAPLAFLAASVMAATSFAADEAKAKAVGPVEVVFVSPDKFTDFKDSISDYEKDRENLEYQFRQHVEQTAKRHLADGQKLEVRFSDIDLAGDFEPWRGVNFHDIRILKDIYPPRIKLEFRLIGADGKVLSEGKRELSDMAYLMTLSIRRDDPLRYDKELVTDWLRREFPRKS